MINMQIEEKAVNDIIYLGIIHQKKNKNSFFQDSITNKWEI